MKILYGAPFTGPSDHFDSGVVGYGITASGAIVRELRRLGHTVQVVPEGSGAATKAEHAALTYRELGRLDLAGFDAIVVYNTFHQFAAEVRRLMYESGAAGTLLAGYTHGSHWDPSDEVRHDYPMLKYADLGNVLALDVVLLVSEYMRDTMTAAIGAELGERAVAQFARRATVVGGTFDPDWLDTVREEKAPDPVIVFNHSPTRAKRPGLSFTAIGEALAGAPRASAVVTRRFSSGDPGFEELSQLLARFPDRVTLGDTMPIEDYFRLLWRSRVQVSTASHESFGVSTVEAIYAGCASLLPAIGCYPEVAGNAGTYAEGGLATALLAHVRDPELIERTRAAQRVAIERYVPASVAARIAAALHDALSAR